MRKPAILIFVLMMPLAVLGQENSNLKNGFIAKGYDVVAYFQGKALKGKKDFVHTYQNANYKFNTEENLNVFKANPAKYIPEYGGFCAWGIADKGERFDINPKSFLIQDEKLYLFYNKWGWNTLKMWQENNPDSLKIKADTKWQTLSKLH
jgi:YHS domain-containing protein